MSTALPAIKAESLDRAALEAAVSGYASTLIAAVHTDAAERRVAGTSPADMAMHLADAADLLDRIGAAFREAAAEARAAIEIDKENAGIGPAATWRVALADGSLLVVGPEKTKTTTWDEAKLSAALVGHTMLRLQAAAVETFEVFPDGAERDRLRAAVEAGMQAVMGMGRTAWRVTDLAYVRQDLANADAPEAPLIDQARTVTETLKDSVKVTRIATKALKP